MKTDKEKLYNEFLSVQCRFQEKVLKLKTTVQIVIKDKLEGNNTCEELIDSFKNFIEVKLFELLEFLVIFAV